MKKLFLLVLSIMVLSSCSKERLTPEGPTDVRIRNLSDIDFTNVIVDNGREEMNYGSIAAKSVSDYQRLEISYNEIQVSATYDGMVYTNGEIDHTYHVYIGQDKVSYEIYPESLGSGVLVVSIVYPYDGPITDL